MTFKEYKEKYPNSVYFSEISSAKRIKKLKENNIKFNRTCWVKGKTKDTDERLIKKNDVWNKGETKENNSIIKAMAEKCSKTSKERLVNVGSKNGMYGKAILDIWREKYGEEKAQELEKQRVEKVVKNNRTKNTKNCIKLKQILREIDPNIVEEFYIYDKKNKKRNFYDAYSPKFNMLFESDGCYWHCKDYYDRKRNFEELNMREKEIILINEYKNELALKNGYRVVRVWAKEEDFLWREIKELDIIRRLLTRKYVNI